MFQGCYARHSAYDAIISRILRNLVFEQKGLHNENILKSRYQIHSDDCSCSTVKQSVKKTKMESSDESAIESGDLNADSLRYCIGGKEQRIRLVVLLSL